MVGANHHTVVTGDRAPSQETTASQDTAVATSIPLLGSCRLLALPAELRNYIYELVATQPHAGADGIDLFTAKPPGTILLQICRQIRNESQGLVTQAEEEYWSSTHFIADVSSSYSPLDILDCLDGLCDNNISLFTRLTVRGNPARDKTIWRLEGRTWTLTVGNYRHRFFVVDKSARHSGLPWSELPGGPIGGKLMGMVHLDGQAQVIIDKAKQCYGTAKLTRREVDQIMVLCTEAYT